MQGFAKSGHQLSHREGGRHGYRAGEGFQGVVYGGLVPKFRGLTLAFQAKNPRFRAFCFAFRVRSLAFRVFCPAFRVRSLAFRVFCPAFRGPTPEFRVRSLAFRVFCPAFRGPTPEFRVRSLAFRVFCPAFRGGLPPNIAQREGSQLQAQPLLGKKAAHEVIRGPKQQFAGRAQLLHLPGFEQHDAVGQLEGFDYVVGDEYHGFIFQLLQLPKLAPDAGPRQRVEGPEGLVEQDNGRVGGQGAGQPHALLLPPES